MAAPEHSVLFVCWGNICRSPIAEAVFRHLIKEKGCSERWTVDSAGTGHWNLGEQPDERGQRVLREHGLSLQHTAKLVREEDFRNFEFILYMDESNMRDLKHFTPADSTASVRPLGDYGLGGAVIEDPYYGGVREFETVFEQCRKACAAFLDSVES